jgi:hypothetical protein
MVFRQPAVIAQDFTAPMTRNGHPFQLASAVSADFDFDFEFEVGLMVILVRSWAMVVFWHKMVKTKNVPHHWHVNGSSPRFFLQTWQRCIMLESGQGTK